MGGGEKMAVVKDINHTSLTVELDGGNTDEGRLIKLRRTLTRVSPDVTPEQAHEAIKKLFALQEHYIIQVGQVDTFYLHD